MFPEIYFLKFLQAWFKLVERSSKRTITRLLYYMRQGQAEQAPS
jgi:hypothetical protein